MAVEYLYVSFEDSEGVCVASSMRIPLNPKNHDDRDVAEIIAGAVNTNLAGYVIPEIQEWLRNRRAVFLEKMKNDRQSKP